MTIGIPAFLGLVAGWQIGGVAVAALMAGIVLVVAIGAWLRGRGRFASQSGTAFQERQLLAIAGEMLCLHGGDGVVLSASGAVRDVTGMEIDEIIGLRLDDFIHLDDRLGLLSQWTHLAAGQEVVPSEFRFCQPNGKVVWIEARFARMPDQGTAVVYGSALRDVTRRLVAESELRDIRDDLSSGIAAGQGTLYRLVRGGNGKWRPIFFAANIERVTGYTVAEAMRQDWLDNLLSLPNRALRLEALIRAIEDGNGTAEYDLPTHSGPAIRVRDQLRRWDRSDATIEIVGYLVDISENYGHDLRLRQAQEEIAAVASSGPGLLYRTVVTSPEDHHIVFVSQNAKELTGFTPEQIKAPGWLKSTLTPEIKILAWQNIRRAIHFGTSSTEYRHLNRNGAWRWTRNTVRHVYGHNRKHELVGYTVDITDEKERAIHLAQGQQAATLGELATGMAHELSQPLASISMAAENAMLSLEINPGNIEVISQKLGRISQQAIRASKLVDHMRIFGRREGGEAHPIALHTALDGALTIIEGRLKKAKVTVDCDVPSGLPNVLGSLVLIEQVIMNLLANACDAFTSVQPPIEPEQRRVQIKVARQDPMIVMTIADHAGGIHNTDLSRVFEPFFTHKPAGEGTGLGLSISYGIISDMGGR